MDLQHTLGQIVWLLMSKGAVSYSDVRAEFGLSNDDLRAIKHELIVVKKCAADDQGQGLVWVLGQPTTPSSDNATDVRVEETKPDDPKLQKASERRPLTIMFCDLADSTEMSTRIDPEDLQRILNQYIEGVTAIVERHAGYVAKYMGDGVLVYFGYPQALERSVEQAITCALEILDFVGKMRPDIEAAEDVDLAVRIGIESGRVVIGELIGKGATQERSVVGETPNLAARLQGLADRNQLVIGPNAHRAVYRKFSCIDLGQQVLKGFARPVFAWAIEPNIDNSLLEYDALPVIFGRDTEIAAISNRWSRAMSLAEGYSVIVRGEAGIGKTRFIERIAAQTLRDGARVLNFQFSPYHTNSALYPLVRFLRKAGEIEPHDTFEDTIAKLGGLFQVDLTASESQLQLLAFLLRNGEDKEALDIAAEAQKQKTLTAFVELVSQLAEKMPLLIVWEDAHWADPTSLELVQLLDEVVSTTCVVMLITTRPTGLSEAIIDAHHVIDLKSLTTFDARNLISHVSRKSLPSEIVEHILARADDIPLFIEETTKTLLHSPVLNEESDSYTLVKPLGSLTSSVPETLQDSLIARLQTAPSLMSIAQVGSIFGREFHFDMVDAVSGLNNRDVLSGLKRLVDGGLIVRLDEDGTEFYAFKHALIQDAAYDSILRRNRKLLHLRAAEFLENDRPEVAKENPEIIARHFSVAQEFEKAVSYFITAGQNAAKKSANKEAVAHLKEALGLVLKMSPSKSRDEVELTIQNSLINPMIATFGHAAPETDATSKRAVELCGVLKNSEEVFPGLYGRWLVNYASARLDAAKRHAVSYLKTADAISGRVPRLVGHRLNGASSLFLGDPETGRYHLTKALELHDPAEDSISALSYSQDFGVSIHGDLALSNALLGNVEEAREWSEKALTRAREIQHANNLAFALHLLSVVGFALADWDMVRDLTEELEQISTQHDLRVFQAGGRVMYASILSQDGNARQGFDLACEAIEVLEEVSFTVYGPISVASKAEALAGLGQADRAIDVLSDGLRMTEKTFEHWYDAELLRRRSVLLADAGRIEEARSDLDRARKVATQQKAGLFAQRLQLVDA